MTPPSNLSASGHHGDSWRVLRPGLGLLCALGLAGLVQAAPLTLAQGKALGLEVVAEGVETEAQREFLMQCGCHAFQGYLFSRPLMEAQLIEFMAARSTQAGAGP